MRSTYIQPDERLLWLFHYADADLGVSAMPWQPEAGTSSRATDPVAAALAPDWVSPPAPNARRVMAARRSTRYREALRAMSRGTRSCLEHCYGHRYAYLVGADGSTQRALTSVSHGEQARRWAEYQAAAANYGIGAAAVLSVLRSCGVDPTRKLTPKHEATVAQILGTVLHSHEAWRTVARGLPAPPDKADEDEDDKVSAAEQHRQNVIGLLHQVQRRMKGAA